MASPPNPVFFAAIARRRIKLHLAQLSFGEGGIETTAYVLGFLNAAGGTVGYVKSGSIPSIVAGCSVGALYALGGYRLQSRASYGVELSLLASIVLAGVSVPNAIRTQKPVPIGLSVLSVYGLYVFGTALQNRR
ncbi:MAG: hypothetical protein M1824_006599 [Vezdaea acicularis]|nr:MAG: hypothetical protein M1824_006599 [Vezdaea acicularis]